MAEPPKLLFTPRGGRKALGSDRNSGQPRDPGSFFIIEMQSLEPREGGSMSKATQHGSGTVTPIAQRVLPRNKFSLVQPRLT